ncbi:MAG: PRC-barrel domain-containing protein [Methylobacterium mesophilicum]|nr:PRC-barrel domain-containing protein [Methylobacterium mesophilicum]
MKNITLAVLLGSSVLVAAPAMAQSSDAPAAPAASTASPMSGGDFLTKRETSQFLASNITGANVMGPQNESVGKVSDMIVDKDGKLAAITVDVGGFLGIGAKTVAIPAQGIQYVPVSATASADNMANNNAMAPAGTAGTATGTATTAPDPAVTGSTTTDSANNGGAMQTQNTTAAATNNGTRLDHIMINFTKDQLQNAPEFKD